MSNMLNIELSALNCYLLIHVIQNFKLDFLFFYKILCWIFTFTFNSIAGSAYNVEEAGR